MVIFIDLYPKGSSLLDIKSRTDERADSLSVESLERKAVILPVELLDILLLGLRNKIAEMAAENLVGELVNETVYHRCSLVTGFGKVRYKVDDILAVLE